MLISHSKKFIFIHIYKTAGTSIAEVLMKYNHLPTKWNIFKSAISINPKVFSSDFLDHEFIESISKKIPNDIFGSYFKFAFVRNPWDWQVSLYCYARQLESHHQHAIVKNMNFKQYIEWRINDDLYLQKQFVCNKEGELLVDYIGKVETIERDFAEVCTRLNIKNNFNLPRLNTTNHRCYKDYYDTNTRDLVAEAFSEDIMLFNYEF